MKMCPVVHFEMPANDRERMAAFYNKAFGWQTQMFGEDMGSYVLATTAESDGNGRPKAPGSINGGFFPRMGDPADNTPRIVIGVEDIHASMGDVKKLGGEVHGDPIDIPGVGQFVLITDTEGNRVALLQPAAM